MKLIFRQKVQIFENKIEKDEIIKEASSCFYFNA